MAVNLTDLRDKNAARWDAAKLNRNFTSIAKALISPQAKSRYQAVEAATKVPWFIVAVIHEREASQKWTTQLGQGDPLNSVSIHVPKGRGPFPTWEQGAYDALVNCAPYAAKNTDWSPGGAMTLLEQYNGLGYANRGLPSPYVWSGTDQYQKGKYVKDGVFDPDVIDIQLGCAGLLKTMMAMDSSIKFGPASSLPAFLRPAEPAPASKPPVVAVSSGTGQNEKQKKSIADFFTKLWG